MHTCKFIIWPPALAARFAGRLVKQYLVVFTLQAFPAALHIALYKLKY